MGREVFATIGRRLFTRSDRKEATTSKLFTPTQVGPDRLPHRIVMAPLTRMRSAH
jgi:N-ethylmaleimide reductase